MALNTWGTADANAPGWANDTSSNAGAAQQTAAPDGPRGAKCDTNGRDAWAADEKDEKWNAGWANEEEDKKSNAKWGKDNNDDKDPANKVGAWGDAGDAKGDQWGTSGRDKKDDAWGGGSLDRKDGIWEGKKEDAWADCNDTKTNRAGDDTDSKKKNVAWRSNTTDDKKAASWATNIKADKQDNAWPSNNAIIHSAPSTSPRPSANDPHPPLTQPYWHIPSPSSTSSLPTKLPDTLFPPLPTPRIPRSLATEHALIHHVSASGPGVLWLNTGCAPVYTDSMARPWAVFVFRYRGRAALERVLGRSLVKEEETMRRWVEGWSREEMVEALLKGGFADGDEEEGRDVAGRVGQERRR